MERGVTFSICKKPLFGLNHAAIDGFEGYNVLKFGVGKSGSETHGGFRRTWFLTIKVEKKYLIHALYRLK